MLLPQRRSWQLRVLGYGVPAKPQTGDREPVMAAISEIIDAAGGVEYTLQVLKQNFNVAQGDYMKLCEELCNPINDYVSMPSAAIVYYDFLNLVVWMRTVDERFKHGLLKAKAVKQEIDLRDRLKGIRSRAGGEQFDDARQLADCMLHRWTPPYSGASPKVEDGRLVWPVPDQIDRKKGMRKNLSFKKRRNVIALADEYFDAVSRFVTGLLDELYPPNAKAHSTNFLGGANE